MFERLAGAVVAIAAAALLVAGVVTSAWWVGETGAGGHGGARDRHIGLRSEEQCFITHEASGKPRCSATTTTDCDSSESQRCQTGGTLKHDTLFGGAGWAASLLGALAALMMAGAAGTAMMTRGRGAARGWASAGAVTAVLAGIAGLAFVLLRPSLPDLEGGIGWSAYAFLGGAGAAVVASMILRREESVVHAHAPAGPVKVPKAMEFDVGALFGEGEASAPAPVAAATFDEKTDRTAAPSLAAFAQTRVASENRADTEKDLPPDDMQGTPAPPAPPAPPPPPPPPPPPMARAKAASLPPLPLPRTKPPSLPPPAKPPATATGTGAAPRIAAPPPVVNPAGPVPACSQCDAPTVWNEEHLRFYCKKCRIYL